MMNSGMKTIMLISIYTNLIAKNNLKVMKYYLVVQLFINIPHYSQNTKIFIYVMPLLTSHSHKIMISGLHTALLMRIR